MTVPTENVEFEYLTSNSDRFTNDFTNFVVTNIPFFALQDQLLRTMEKRNNNQFRIPGSMTVDSKDHIFYFKLIKDDRNSRIRRYQYVGMDVAEKADHGHYNHQSRGT